MSVELFAVNAVSDRIAACPRLSPDMKIGDKTPVTDGHIDFYSSEKQNNKTREGRVPVQVKGRVTATKVKAARDTQSFSVEREALQFFRNHGGGVYFYVPMREGGVGREVFYSILLPFKVDRMFEGKPASQKTFSVKMTRLPEEATKIEAIVRLAWKGRTQVATAGDNSHLMGQAERLTVHSLAGFDETRPTRLALAETDYVVVAHLAGGVEIPLDIDLDVFPSDYIESPLAAPIACGGITFSGGTGRRIDENTVLVRLAKGLELTLKVSEQAISTTLNLTGAGSFREQAKNVDFVLAAAAGNPLIVGDGANERHVGDAKLTAELQTIRDELTRLIELFDELGIDDAFTSQLELNRKTKRMLLALRDGLVDDKPVRGSSDGTGRYDVPVGNQSIMVIVMPAEEEGFRRVIDPFDPSKRERFRIYGVSEDGAPELIDWGTVYEPMTAEDMSTVLNLRLRNLVDAYEALDDHDSAHAKANYTVLRLLSATDMTLDASHRAALLGGAADLCEWLLRSDPDSLVHRVNWWQILHRRGEIDDDIRREIRTARRSLNQDDELATLLEICMLILLGDIEEVHLAMEDLTDEEAARVRSWPVWGLTGLDQSSIDVTTQ